MKYYGMLIFCFAYVVDSFAGIESLTFLALKVVCDHPQKSRKVVRYEGPLRDIMRLYYAEKKPDLFLYIKLLDQLRLNREVLKVAKVIAQDLDVWRKGPIHIEALGAYQCDHVDIHRSQLSAIGKLPIHLQDAIWKARKEME